MENEVSTFIDPDMDAEVNLPLKNSKKQMMLKQELIDEGSVTKQVQQGGILIELQKNIKELIEDCEPKRQTKEAVKETRGEFDEQLNLDAKYTQTRGILIEAEQKLDEHQDEDFLERAENLMQKLREEYVLELNSDIQPTNAKEVHMEEDLIECRTYAEGVSQKKANSSIDMTTIIEDINHFSERLENKSENVDWQQFRSNLLKIHRHYIREHQETQMPLECNPEKVDLLAPLTDLALQSKALSNHIDCIENKISSLNLRVENFHREYSKTLVNREKAARDLMSLQSLRETIGRKLTQMEMEIHSAQTRLLRQRERYVHGNEANL